MKLESTIHFDPANNAVFCRFQMNGELSEEKRKEYRDTLVEAFSMILGLHQPSDEDFEPIEAPPSDLFEDDIYTDFDISFEDDPETVEEQFEVPVEEEVAEEVEPEEPTIGFGPAANLKPSEILKDSRFGAEYLQRLLPILERNADRFPANQVKINAIKRVLSRAS